MDITKLFKSKTRKELFRIYFTNSESEYYLRELERLLGLPVSMIRHELVRLQEEGIFNSHRKGNLVYFSLNKSYPLFDEFKSIVFKTIGVKGLIKESLEKIKGVEAAFVYGSFAKNEEKATSDIDLCLIGNIDEGSILKELKSLEKALKREINYILYNREEFRKKKIKKDSFIGDLLENKKIFLVGSEDDL
jgi:predicted nucleotidyltransferase